MILEAKWIDCPLCQVPNTCSHFPCGVLVSGHLQTGSRGHYIHSAPKMFYPSIYLTDLKSLRNNNKCTDIVLMCISRGNLHVSSHNVIINFLAIFLQMCSKQNVALHHILTDFQLRGSNNDSAKQTLQKSSSHIDYCFMTFCSSMSVIVKIRVDGEIFITFISISGSNPRSHWIPQQKQLFWGCLIF